MTHTHTHRVTSIEFEKRHAPGAHRAIASVETREADGLRRWSVEQVLEAMNRAERFYTKGANGRSARIQRYSCATCRTEHIRTHVGDAAIDDLHALERGSSAASPKARAV